MFLIFGASCLAVLYPLSENSDGDRYWFLASQPCPSDVLGTAFTFVHLLRGPESNRRLEVMLTTTIFIAGNVCGLDYVFAHEGCLPSSLYTFPAISGIWLGIAVRLTTRGVHRIWQIILCAIARAHARIVQASRGTSPLPRY